MKYKDEEILKGAIDILTKKNIDSEILSHLRRLFTIRIWEDSTIYSPTRYYLLIGREKQFSFTVQLNAEMYEDFKRWLEA